MRLYFTVSLLLWVGLVGLSAQSTDNKPSHVLSVTYFGETLLHPGVSIMYHRSLKDWEWKKVKKNGKEKIRIISLAWSNRLAFYHHRRNHNGNILATGVDLALTKKKGWYMQLGLFTGANLRYFNEAVFVVNANNQVERVKNANNLNFIYGLNTSFGKNFQSEKFIIPCSVYMGSNVFWGTPFGTRTIYQNAIELGLRYRL